MTDADVDQSALPADLARQWPLIEQLSLEEKVHLLTGETAFTLAGNDTIGLAPLAFSDGPTGVRGLKFVGGDAVALFPNATLIAGSWDDEIAFEVGEMLAQEAHRQDIHVVLGPTINLHRSALGGRLFEAYSEDPLLTGRTAAAYVNGMQDKGIGACPKHLVANESETLRNFMDSLVSDKTLREVYLLPFEMAVHDAHVWAMMSAYNDINGVCANEHREIQHDLVKREWDWDGLVMSDWFATKRTVASVNGGLDLVMPGPVGPWGDRLVDAVRRGEVAESTIDEHVGRLLLLAERTGNLNGARSHNRTYPAPDSPERRDQLRRIASRGMVLVKNDGVLPLTSPDEVALIGRHALQTQGMGGGSAKVNPPHLTNVADAFVARLDGRVRIVDGVNVRTRPVPADPAFVLDPATGEPGMQVSYLNAAGEQMSTRHQNGTAMSLGWDDDLPEAPAGVTLTAQLRNQAGPVRIGGIAAGTWTLSSDAGVIGPREVPITGFDPGESMLRPPYIVETVDLPADAVVTVRFDVVEVDWAARFASNPALRVAEETHMLAADPYGAVALVAEQRLHTDDDALVEAEQAARSAGTAIVVVGLTDEDETEAIDKSTLALPGRQDELVRRVAAAAQRTIVVVNAATPILMPWLDAVDAVLIAGLPGQEAGDAIVDVLTGQAEPTGRLVTSYPREDGAAPAWNVTPDEALAVRYEEGTAIGYRGHHRGLAPDPLFWFGHGLGYGSWEYGEARLTAAGDNPVVEVTITNTGDRESRETVQVYFHPDDPAEPVRLVGYAGVLVAEGARETVEVDCEARLLRRWDESGEWRRVGAGELLVARGLGDVRAGIRLS